MKTTNETTTKLIVGDGTDAHPLVAITIAPDGQVSALGVRGSAEFIERVAAALKEHRGAGEDYDFRSVCADHGYHRTSDSQSGYRCSVCDPKLPVEPVPAEPDGGVIIEDAKSPPTGPVVEGDSDELRSAT